ncbi:THNSL1 [Branchiostoma lanceolatum]|uniref:THNSL1 protein n=1 Tax=Branchiostoma lanceolatum TaxID=7740 RepID=A0A8K0ERX9_BRALA|nr:THNSL1 [Branchiostoma lanceolatum]
MMVWWRLYSRLRCSQQLVRLSCLQLRNYSSCDGAARSVRNRKGNNIILMGSPGAGKTTVGRILAGMLDKPVKDIDNDHLESHWGIPVAEQLSRLGPEGFLEAEGEAVMNFTADNCVISLTGSNPMHHRAMEHISTLADNCVISLTGSNPMHHRAMEHISTLGTVVFLDVPSADILHRLEVMKVNRIVGQGAGMDMADILRYRQQFYEGQYDIRVLCGNNESAEDIARKVQEVLTWHQDSNKYISTRQSDKKQESRTFSEVVLEGLAPDGGLYVPKKGLRRLRDSEWGRLVQCSYQERALRILEQCIPHAEVHPSVLKNMVQTAYAQDRFSTDGVVPLVQLNDNQHVMELFHGPTASFKDLALQLMPQFYAEFSRRRSEGRDQHRSLILVATSGDTGGAVLDGFSRLPEPLQKYVAVMVLYPEDGISPIQKAQMTTNQAGNVHVVGVQSDFDFCQSTVKSIFKQLSGSADESSSGPYHPQYGVHLSAANSINWGRLLPQVVYHASAYLDLVKQGTITMGQEVDICIPTGNFGNILGAVYAKRMGIPFKRFICASNQNNVLTDFLNTGCYDLRHRRLHQTMSPSIDILVSSNLERFLHLLTDDGGLTADMFHLLEQRKLFKVTNQMLSQLQEDFCADWCHEEDCAKTIQTIFQSNGYLLDPHTAVAKTVADRFSANDRATLLASTAHYCKFAPDVLTALGRSLPTNSPVALFQALQELKPCPSLHGQLSKDIQRPRRHQTVLDTDRSQIVAEMESFMGSYFGK